MRKTKVVLTALLLFISIIPINCTYAAADITKPVFQSISVNKTEVIAGDTVKVSVKASDDVGIQRVYVYYKTPITQKSLYVSMSYNPTTSAFEGNIPISSNMESGLFKIYYITIYDTSDNSTTLADYQGDTQVLVGGQFTVSGTTADVTKPVFNSISVDKSNATVGDTVKVSVKASDNVGIQRIYVYYKTPITQKSLYVSMSYNPATSAFEGNIPISSDMESGLFKIYYITIYDTSDNSTTLADYQGDTQVLVGGQFTVSGTTADVTKPVFNSISVDKSNATVGDTVKVSVKASDNEGIQRIYVYYKTPITQKSLYVSMSYNSATSAYEGNIPISATTESGLFKIYYITIYDTSDNSTTLADYQGDTQVLAKGQFTVITESNPPSFSKLSIDKNVAESGDIIHFTVNATDDTNLQSATVNYITPSQSKVSIPLQYNGTQFTGDFSINDNTETGNWKADSVEVIDTNGNTTVVKASETDLSANNFSVIKGVEALNKYIVNSNESWSNRTVNSDVYILPGATLTINGNVTINGNIYVLGGMRSYGGLTAKGSIIANSFTFGYYTPTNGQVILSGSNSISSLMATNRIMTNVPFNLYDTPIVSMGGRVNLTGATLPFVTLEINGQGIPLKSNGTLRLNDFNIGTSSALNVKITDLSGYTYNYSYGVAAIYIDDLIKDTKALTGKTLPDVTVKVFENNKLLTSGRTDEKGNFNIPVTNLTENAKIYFKVLNTANEIITSKEVLVKDTTAPLAPTVNIITDKDTVVTGTAEANTLVYVKVGTMIIGRGKTGTTGKYTVTIPLQKAGTKVGVVVKDAGGNYSPYTTMTVQDKTAPSAPTVNVLTDRDTIVTGTAESNSLVYVKVGQTIIGRGRTDVAGKYSVNIPLQKAGTKVGVVVKDAGGNYSPYTTMTVQDKTAPSVPTVNVITDKDTIVTGTAESNSLVYVKVGQTIIGRGRTDAAGKYSVNIPLQKAGTKVGVVVKDAGGNYSPYATMTVQDKTAPPAPTLNVITDKDTIVTGTAETNTLVYVKVGSTIIGRGKTDPSGKFSVLIPVQKAGTRIGVVVKDSSGNYSPYTTKTVARI